jgi:hypothetical protein
MAHEHHTRRFDRTAEAIITLFCLIDDAYALLIEEVTIIRRIILLMTLAGLVVVNRGAVGPEGSPCQRSYEGPTLSPYTQR